MTKPSTPSSASAVDFAISARNLTLTLGSSDAPVDILRGIDLDIAHGEVVALLGPSGSGKSSLMAVLSGLERATGGSLTVAGQDFSNLDEDGLAAARRGRIGIVLQSFHLLPTMTAVENVATPMELAGSKDATSRAAAELEAVGLGHRIGHYPTQLSGGEQQRVAIARAIAPRPQLIFADEPTGNLDVSTGQEIIELLFSRRAETGATLLIITHDPKLAEMCERVLTMADGVIVSDTRSIVEQAAAEAAE
ncbi:MAG: ABC transporter ATP-binding protein [Erythrobacter sp.]|uniref:ABC transporter ATP-binding protein n=1 Tax=Erythrobacter sp. TaxID=1042 RepID=UPI003A8932B3